MGLINAELRKLRTVTTTWVLTGVGLVLVGGIAALTLFVDPTMQGGRAFTGSDLQIAAALDQISQGAILVLVVALLAMTTEFRHGTIGRTLQITPSRTRVLLSKLTATGIYALVFCVLAIAVVFALVALGVAFQDATLDLGSEVAAKMWQAPVALVLTALFGVAFGALVRNQVVAVTVTLVWYMVVETIVSFQLPRIGRFLPFTAMTSVFLSPETVANVPEGMMQPLAPGAALAVFSAYVVVFSAAALALMRYRDV